MLRAIRLLCLSAGLLVCLVPAVDAQRLGPPQKRPKLAAGADTNDASAYIQHGTKELEMAPDEAAAAFYWAARLDPSSADALYGRSVALAMRKATTLMNYLNPRSYKARTTKEMLGIDSLRYRALQLDPLFYPRFYTTMERAYLRAENREYAAVSPQEFNQAVRMVLNESAPYVRGRVMWADGRLDQAIMEYGDAIKRWKDIPTFRMERARVHATKGDLPSAIKDFDDAIAQLKEREEKRDVNIIFYDNRAIAEQSLGVLWARRGDADSAKAAHGRATAEDLSFYPAHVSLGLLALGLKDTATAVSELALAADLATDEPHVHYLHGSVLVSATQYADAIAPLRKSIALEPFYAAPHLALAQALEKTADAPGAKAAYESFLKLAPRRDPGRTLATQRLAALGGATK